jgi:hypothetical protein
MERNNSHHKSSAAPQSVCRVDFSTHEKKKKKKKKEVYSISRCLSHMRREKENEEKKKKTNTVCEEIEKNFGNA